MATGAIVTLCALAACLIAFGIILAVMGGKPKYFVKGKRYSGSFNRLKTTFIIGEAVGIEASKDQGELMAQWCSVINDAVRFQFSRQNLFVRDAFDQTKNIIVQLMDEASYNAMGGKRHREHYVHSGACMALTRCWFWGTEIPTVCIKVRTKKALKDFISKYGEPVVHELCHAYLDDYTADDEDHSDKRVWTAISGEDAIQYKARETVSAYTPKFTQL